MSWVEFEDVLGLAAQLGLSAVAVSERGSVRAQRGEEAFAASSDRDAIRRITGCAPQDPALEVLLAGFVAVQDIQGTNGRFRVARTSLESGARLYLLSPGEASLDGWTLARASRVREMSSVLHEVATSLTSVTGWIDLARKDPKRVMEALGHAEESAELARKAARTILESLRTSASDTGVLDDLVRRAATSQGAIAAQRNIRLRVTEGAPSALASRPAIWTIVATLVENAIEASPENTDVHVRTLPLGGGYAIEVEDRGPGMPTDAPTEHVSTKAKGSGLGLQIVRRAAQDMGASLSFTAAEPHGTIARIEVPLGRSLAGMRVLVVEDDPRLRKLLGDFLRGRGARVTEAGSAHEARETSSEFDVLVVDRTLPDGQGNLVLSELAARCPDAARVLASGGTEPADLSASLPPATVWLRKPFAPPELLDGIARALGKLHPQPGN